MSGVTIRRMALAAGVLGSLVWPLASSAGAASAPHAAASVTLSRTEVTNTGGPPVFTEVLINHFLRFQPYNIDSPTLDTACSSVVIEDWYSQQVAAFPNNFVVDQKGHDIVFVWGYGCNPGTYPITVTQTTDTHTSFNPALTVVI
jgi:hypothetical protein